MERIIQFGEGGFLRGFVDYIVQILNDNTDFDGSVVVVQPIANGLCDMLEAQNCVYTHLMRGLKEGVPTVEEAVVKCISRTVKPYDNWDAYMALADVPSFRFVVSNTTEAGIAFDEKDTPNAAPNVTVPAKVALLLKRRFEKGLPGFIFLPCELIDKNGATLKACILKYADLWGWDAAFKDWVESDNVFCNTLVDRIVTGYPKGEEIIEKYNDNLLNTSERFLLWVIEGPKTLLDEIPFDKTGLDILVTDELERYRTRKVRILNGAHTSMIPYALLSGLETVGDCMKDPTMSAFVKACVYEEILPTLDLPESELKAYADSVFERFENPYIRHRCESIALNSISKFRVRVLPSILMYIDRKGAYPTHLLTAFAKLIALYQTDLANDAPDVIAAVRGRDLRELLADESLWGTDLSFLTDEMARRLAE